MREVRLPGRDGATMNRINPFTGPRVQTPTTAASGGAARTGFGSPLQPGGGLRGAGAGPGDSLMVSGGQVVAAALSSAASSGHGGVMNSYLSAVGRAPINTDGSRGGAQGASTAPAGSEQAQQEAVLMELATLSAATFSNSILAMGNGMKVTLERE